MKLSFLLGTFAIVTSINACARHDADPGQAPDDGEAAEEQREPGTSKDGDHGADRDSNSSSDNAEAEDEGESHSGGSAADDDAAGVGASGPISNSGGSAGLSGSGGSGGIAGNGSGGIAGNGSGGIAGNGSGGIAGNGSGGVPAGSAGVAGSAGSGGLASSGGSAGVAESAGSGGLASSGGSGGVVGSGGVAGSTGGDGGLSLDPEHLFTKETFGGNGRTCLTCHTAKTGTLSPEQVQTLFAADPTNPLFRPLDSDDGASNVYTKLRERATFRVTIGLPEGVRLASDESATSITVRRGVPSTINTPALDPVIMWDGRERDLASQALSAILGHAQATVTPTTTQIQLITQFERGPAFFSSDLLRQYSEGGPAPSLPAGVTAAEQRGRRWFVQDSAAPRFNICGQCHGGPLLNETQANSGLPVGKHFQTVNVSEINPLGNPTFALTFPNPKSPATTVTVVTPDPGRALVTGDVRDLNFFKIPTLWGVQHTAPYFHDDSVTTLEELMNHYERHLATFLPRSGSYPSPHVPTAEDKVDIIAYLKLL